MPGQRTQNSRSSSGVVLVVVLVSLMALSGLVLSQFNASSTAVLATASLPGEYEAGLLAETALALAQDRLLKDNDEFSDTPLEPWAKPLELPGLNVTITPCNAFVNLNEVEEESEEQALTRLLRRPTAPAMVLNLQIWIAPELGARLPAFRRPNYSGRPYVPRGKALTRPEEALLVDGWGDVSPEWVRRHGTVWGDGRINLNFASAPIIRTMLPELAPYLDELIHLRSTRGITDVSQLLEITNWSADSNAYQETINRAAVSAQVFRVIVQVDNGSCFLEKRYILQRNPLLLEQRPKLIQQDDLRTALSNI